MKKLLILTSVLLSTLVFSQTTDRALAQVMKIDGVNIFVKSKPYEYSYFVEEIKVSGFLKSTKEQSKMTGGAGYKLLTYAITEGKKELMKSKDYGSKKMEGQAANFNGIRMVKGNKFELLNVHTGKAGASSGISGALALVEAEKKTDKLIFYAAKPLADYEVVSEISYNESGLGETMRGVTFADIAINGMLDKGVRWVKKEKISSFDAIIIDWRAMRSGKVKGELIRFK